MFLPEAVRYCLDKLKQAGFRGYAVGGCVRDSLLGITPHDYDLCSDAKPEDMCRIFDGHTLVRSGEKHGTIGVVIDKEVIEITTFRTEGQYKDNRHPDWVEFVGSVEEDLARPLGLISLLRLGDIFISSVTIFSRIKLRDCSFVSHDTIIFCNMFI